MKYLCMLFLAAVFAVVSCKNNKDILAENIERIYVDYDVYSQNNVGTSFNGTISVLLKTGEDIQLKNNKGFNSSPNFDARIKDKKLTVYGPLTSFSANKIPVQLYFTDRNNVQLTFQDSVLLNFTGNTQAWYTGYSGSNGTAGENGKTPLLFRDGTDGGFGGIGETGTNGDELEVYVWAKGDTLFCYVFDVTRNYGDRYKIVGLESKFYIEASGGNGGAGGKGGDGGDGKKGEVSSNATKVPGTGGRGGNGGQGGRGGNGGRVVVNIHPSAGDAQSRLVIRVDGGNGGSGGTGGTGGRGGAAATGQLEGAKGANGANGASGISGFQGSVSFLTRAFDFSVYN